MKNKLFGFALLGVASASFVLASCQAEPPAAKEGVIYQTDVESFWVGVGHAYMSFEYVEEAAEGELSGYVFKVNVDAGDGYSGMTLTVVTDQANVLSEDAYAVSFGAVSSPGDIVYTCVMTVNVPQVGEMNFNFTATMAIPA